MTTATPLTSESHASPPEGVTRSRTESCLWMGLGALAAHGTALVAFFVSMASIENSTDDYAMFTVLAAVPFGFVLGLLAAIIFAWKTERGQPSAEGLFTRTELATSGGVLPLGTLIGLSILLNALFN